MTDEKKRGRRFLPPLILLALALLLLVIWGVQRGQTLPPAPPNATVGVLPGRSLEQVEAELQERVAENEISFNVNSEPTFPDGESMGNLRLDCPANNVSALRFLLTRDDTGERLYDSGVLQPGMYVEEDYLQTDDPLKAGRYPCTVAIEVLDPDTGALRGETAVTGVLLMIER